MCLANDPLTAAYGAFQDELVAAGLLIPMGVPGLYGRSGVFEGVIEHFEAVLTRHGQSLHAEVMRFPPIMNRIDYLRTSHVQNFPDLMGSLHTFTGTERDHRGMLAAKEKGEDWTRQLSPAETMMVPAVCYPLYPTATGTLPEQGRLVDLVGYVYRHEPSPDPARMQQFRQREFVRLGNANQAVQHRDDWLRRGLEILRSLGLDVQSVAANDPFFGRGGQVMAASQIELNLKFELVIPIASAEKLTAIASSNLHLDYFGNAFQIQSSEGTPAHTACIGFGLERIALALFKTHGFDPAKWPAEVKQILAL